MIHRNTGINRRLSIPFFLQEIADLSGQGDPIFIIANYFVTLLVENC